MGVGSIPKKDKKGNALQMQMPVSSNELNGETLYLRIHGVKASFTGSETKTLVFVNPYDDAMIQGAEIVYDVMATTNLIITDGDDNEIDQYGFDVNMGVSAHGERSPYVAEVPKDYKFKAVITNTSGVTKEIGVNFILHESKE